MIHGMSGRRHRNDGPITTHGATKAGQYIQLCNQAALRWYS